MRQRAYKRQLTLRDLKAALQAYGKRTPGFDFVDFAAHHKAEMLMRLSIPPDMQHLWPRSTIDSALGALQAQQAHAPVATGSGQAVPDTPGAHSAHAAAAEEPALPASEGGAEDTAYDGGDAPVRQLVGMDSSERVAADVLARQLPTPHAVRILPVGRRCS